MLSVAVLKLQPRLQRMAEKSEKMDFSSRPVQYFDFT